MPVLEIHYTDTRDLVTKLRTALNEHEEWVTTVQLQHRYGLTRLTLFQRLARWEDDKVLTLDKTTAVRGRSGRVRLIKMTPQLRALMENLR